MKHVTKEKIIRTFHIEKECKDYNGGPSKYLGYFMRDVIFQNEKYAKTLIYLNPYCLLYSTDYDVEELQSRSYELEELSYKVAKNFELKIIEIIYEKPKEQLISIFEGYEELSRKIDSKGRISIPSKIFKKLKQTNKGCKIYYDEELGDVFIHININDSNNLPNDIIGINNRFHKK